MAAENGILCQICQLEKRKYICPKCGIPYCSLNCYQNIEKHIQCSESFYRDCVEQELRLEQDPAKAKQMQSILQRTYENYMAESQTTSSDEEEMIDSDDDEPLSKRLEGINLDDSELVWDLLTYEEREDFKRFTAKNQTEQGIPIWIPWWTLPIRKVVIEEVKEKDTTSCSDDTDTNFNWPKLNTDQPSILHSIPKMSSLTTIPPNECVKYGVANVIGSYAWTIRLFNGVFPGTNASERHNLLFSILSLSDFLTSNQVFQSFRLALGNIVFNASKVSHMSEYGSDLQENLERDTFLILSGGQEDSATLLKNGSTVSKSYVLSALTECHRLVIAVIEDLKEMKPQKSPEKESSSSIKKDTFAQTFSDSLTSPVSNINLKTCKGVLRKVVYLLAYTQEFDFFG